MSAQEPKYLPAFLKGRIAAVARLEYEQARLRLVSAAFVLMYVAWYVMRNPVITQAGEQALVVTLAFLVFAVLATVGVVFAPGSTKGWRIAGMIADNAIVTYAIFMLGEGGAVIVGTYLFLSLGNGFRYGRFYLHASQIMSIVGFSLVLVISPFWSDHVAIGMGFLISLVVIPFYVGMLAERIQAARKHAEDALRDRQRGTL